MPDAAHHDSVHVDPAVVRAKAAHARRVASRMMTLGWFVLAAGMLAMLVTVGEWLLGDVAFGTAATEFSALLLGTVLTGVATYGTGLNLSMNADRLELSLPR